MHLIDRIARLLRADAHGVVDALEERGLLLRQHLREAELEILQKRARVEALELEAARLAEERERRQQRAEALDADIELALAGDKDDLARFAAAQLLAERRDLEALDFQHGQVEEARSRVAELLADQEQMLDQLSARARSWLAGRERALSDELAGRSLVADEEVELELMRRRRTAVVGAR
jgi:phage shock protein A